MLKTYKKPLLIVSGLLVLLITAWCIALECAKTHILKEFDKTLTHLKSRGYEVSYGTVTFGGTPLWVKGCISDLKILTPHQWGSGEIRTLTVSLHPWSWNHLFLDFGETAVFDVPPSFDMPLLKMTCSQCKSEVWLKDHHWNAIEIHAENMTFKDSVQDLPLALQETHLDLFNDLTEKRFHVNLEGKILGVGKIFSLEGYDHPIDLTLKSEVSNVLDDPQPKTLVEWRDQGGVLDITQLSFSWPPLNLIGDGTLTFDEKMRPLGAFSATITGYDQALAVMSQVGAIKKKTSQIAGFALGLLAHKNSKGDMEITVPITAQNGFLSVGPADLIPLGSF